MFRGEVKRLVILKEIKHANEPEWVANSFAQPKAKTIRVILLSDYWNLNRQLKCKTNLMSKICEMLLQ